MHACNDVVYLMMLLTVFRSETVSLHRHIHFERSQLMNSDNVMRLVERLVEIGYTRLIVLTSTIVTKVCTQARAQIHILIVATTPSMMRKISLYLMMMLMRDGGHDDMMIY